MAILLFRRFGCEMPISSHFGEFFLGFYPLNVIGYCQDPQKAHPWKETRFGAQIVPIGQEMRPGRVAKKNQKKKEKKRNSNM